MAASTDSRQVSSERRAWSSDTYKLAESQLIAEIGVDSVLYQAMNHHASRLALMALSAFVLSSLSIARASAKSAISKNGSEVFDLIQSLGGSWGLNVQT
jgi:hypothetical protein